jgi:large repetitive protein
MVGSGISMTAARNLARAGATALVALVMLIAGHQGIAMAAAPELMIDQPVSGSATSQQTPVFEGTTTDALDPLTLAFDPVTLKITGNGGSPAQSWTVFAPKQEEPWGDIWEITPGSPLEEGQYTAIVEQTSSESGTGTSNSVAFTVETTPLVTLTSPDEGAVLDTSNPTFTGGAGAAQWDGPVKVTIHEGSLAGTIVASGSASMDGGSWFYAPHLGDGTYTAQASQGDEVGNTGTSSAVTFTVDATAPVVTLSSPSDGAVLDTSNPTLSGGAATAPWDAASVTVAIHQGDSLSGKLEASGSVPVSGGEWSYGPDLSDGVYTAQASQGDEAGHTGTSASVTFTVDANAPVVTLTSPAGGALLTSSSQSLSGAAASAPWDDPSVTVAIHQGDSLSGKLEASGSVSVSGGKWSYGSHLSTGEYTAQASQTDQAGHTGTSAAVTFTVDATPPAVTLTSPTEGALVESSEPTLSGGAGAGAWDDQTVTVAIHEGGSLTGEVVALESVPVTDGTWSYPVPELSNGIYTAQASQSDEAGHTGTSTAITFTVDATAPEVTLTSPADNAYVRTSDPTLSGGAGAAAWDSRSVAVAIHDGTTLAGGIAASGTVSESSGKWAYSPSHLSDGTYTAEASQKDEAGHTGESTPVTFTVDTTPPALTLLTPTNDEVLHTSRPTFSGAAGDAPGDQATVTLKIYKGSAVSGTPTQTLELTPDGGAWSTGESGPALANGTYTALAEQSDEAGNRTERTATFTVATKAPDVTLSTSGFKVSETHLLAEATPSFSGTGATEPEDEKVVTVNIYSGTSTSGTAVRTLTGSLSGSTWEAGPVGVALEDGVYTAQAEQKGPLAQTGVSSAVTFTVDTTTPIVTLTPPGNNKNFVKTSEPTLTGAAGAAAWDDAVTVEIHEGGSLTGKLVASGSVPASTTWSYSAPHLRDGVYTAEASQDDEAGHAGTSGAVTFTVDTTPPLLTLETPEEKEVLHTSQPIFSGRAGEASGDLRLVTLRIYKGNAAPGKLLGPPLEITPAGGRWTTGASGPALPNGTYTAVAEQSDEAGNATQEAVIFKIETKSPNVTIDTASGFAVRGSQLVAGPTPSFSGTGATEPGDGEAITVKIYSVAPRSLVRTVTGPLSGSGWTSGPVESPLPDGVYTVQAEQTDSTPLSETGVSSPVEFTVDADAPQVTLTSPANGSSSSSSSQTLSGAAGTHEGDLPGITVQLYAGASIPGQAPLQSVSVQASGGGWSASFGGLSPGTYTAQAEQSDDVGNIGRSEPVTFTVLAPSIVPPAAPPPPPVAAFKWAPAAPRTNEPVTLASSSTDGGSAIKSFAWALTGNGVFTQGESVVTTSFSTAGPHVVQLRVTDANGLSSTVAETIAVASAPVPLMQPFPVVRMSGSFGASGAKISLLAALAPVGATVTVTCHGRGCPAKSQAFVATSPNKSKAGAVTITFRRFERFLRGGVVLEIWISKHGQIGKFTRFVIHRGKSPSRVDECLNPAGTTPLVCPS